MADISTDELERRVFKRLPFDFSKVTIADDAFSTITPVLQSGLIIVTLVNSSASSQGIYAFDVDSGGASCVLVTTATNFEATTGTLNGTTGTDAKFTLSAHTDGKLYLENRLAAEKNIHWIII